MTPTVFAAIVATFMSTDTAGRSNDVGVLPLLKRHKIQVLFKVGLSQDGTSLRTKHSPAQELDDQDGEADSRRTSGRSTAEFPKPHSGAGGGAGR